MPLPAAADAAPQASADDSIDALMRWQQEHARRAGRVQRFANHVTGWLGRPIAVAVVLALIALWIGANLVALHFGVRPFEQFPFPDLAFVATLAAFLLSLLILTAQRHADELADQRAQLTLLIALQNEKKCAKIIQLLEEQRRDNPMLQSRADPQADALAQSENLADTLTRLTPEAE